MEKADTEFFFKSSTWSVHATVTSLDNTKKLTRVMLDGVPRLRMYCTFAYSLQVVLQNAMNVIMKNVDVITHKSRILIHGILY